MAKHLSIVLLVVFLAAVPAAFGQADFTDTVTFGDSLTHNDLLWLYYGNPPDLYEADPMEAVFDKGAAAGDDLTSYAVAGSESKDVELQIDLYFFNRLIQSQDQATLFGFEIGGNDVLNSIGLLAANPPGQNPSADAVIDGIIANMKSDLFLLRRTHKKARFVVWTIPDVTLTPGLWNSLSPGEVANVRAHLERVNTLIRSLDALPYAVVLDLYTLLEITVANPPVLFGHQLVPPPAHGDYDDLFADEIHPTAVSNALIANAVVKLINAKWNDDIPLYTKEELADLAHIPH